MCCVPAILNHVDAAGSRPQVPEPDRLILRSGSENGPAPGAEREDVASVTRVRLPDRERGRICAVRHVNTTIAGTAGD